MNREKQSNRPVIVSIISLMACIALLIGITMAWFTDTETNTGNRIEAGTLDVKLYKWTATTTIDTTIDEDWTQITNETGADFIFGEFFENWQPGDTETIYLAVENAGSLDFDYNIDLVVEDESLADALQVSISSATDSVSGMASIITNQTISSLIDVDADGAALEETTDTIYLAQTGLLNAGKVDYIQVDITLDDSTGNTYQGLAFEMDLILTATQKDEDDTIVKAFDVTDIQNAEVNQTVILMNDIETSEDITFDYNVNFDLNGYILKAKSFSMTTEETCTIDIANGTIMATDGDITINAINGSITFIDQDSFLTDGYSLKLTASPNTITMNGAVGIYKITADTMSGILAETTTIAAVKADTANTTAGDLDVTAGTKVVLAEDTTVTANLNAVDSEGNSTTDTYVFDAAEGSIVVGTISGATTAEGSIFVSGDEDALITAMSENKTATAFTLSAGTYNAPTEITSSVTITGVGSTRLDSSEVTTLAFSQGLEISTDDVELTLVSLDLDADITTGKFNNGYGIIELKNASNVTLNIEDSYVVEKDIVITTNYISASIYLEDLENPTINVDNSYLLGRYTIMVASYTDSSSKRGYSHNVTDAVYNITDSTLEGWTTGNMRGEDTVYTATNCILIGQNAYSGTSNSYSTFVMTDGSIDSVYTLNNCVITATNTGDQEQNCFSFQYGATNNTLYLNDCEFEMYTTNDVSAAVISVSTSTSATYPTTSGVTVVLDGTTYSNLAIDKYLITDGELIEQ